MAGGLNDNAASSSGVDPSSSRFSISYPSFSRYSRALLGTSKTQDKQWMTSKRVSALFLLADDVLDIMTLSQNSISHFNTLLEIGDALFGTVR